MKTLWAFLSLGLVATVGCNSQDPRAGSSSQESAPACPSFVQAAKGLPEEGEWKSIPSIGDVNEDGLGDIAVLPRKGTGPKIFLSDGVGGWTDASEELKYPTKISCGIGTRLADIDRDGHIDLLFADHCEGVFVFRGDGKGHWTAASEGIPRNIPGVNDADAGDLDGDGLTDIVAVSAFTNGFLVLKGQPDGSWMIWPGTGLPDSGLGFAVRLVDVTGDGLLDVVTSFQPTSAERRASPPPPAKVWVHGPVGRFHPASGFPEKGRFYSVVAWARDGRPVRDVLTAVSGAYGGLYRYESSTGEEWKDTGRFDDAGFPEQGAGFIGLTLADLDGNGCEDIVTSEGGSGRVWLAMGDCKGDWRFCPEGTLPMERPLPTWGVVTGDLNGDGRTDIAAAFGRGKLGGVKAWFQTGSVTTAGSRAQGQGPDSNAVLGSGTPVPEP